MEFRNVAAGRIPKYLPIQVKICVDDSVPHRDDLPPGHFRVSVSQLHGETANDGSCRIDDSGIFENRRAYPRLQAALGNQVNSAPSERGQLFNEGFELHQSDSSSRFELDHEVDVTFRTHLAADGRPKQGELSDAVAAADLRERSSVDLQVIELECLVHGLN